MASLNIIMPISKNLTQIEAPSPLTLFDKYYVLSTKTAGVCQIFAFGPDFPNDQNGKHVMDAYYSLLGSLQVKYGRAASVIDTGDVSNGSGTADFAISLKKELRKVSSTWIVTLNTQLEKTNLYGLQLRVSSNDGVNTNLIIAYTFKNRNECAKEIDKELLNAL